jgi:hypothetical protein
MNKADMLEAGIYCHGSKVLALAYLLIETSDVRWKIFHRSFSSTENFPENFPQYFSRKFSVS